MSQGKLFIISGASGVGKSTVLSRVMAARDDLKFSVSATTRAPRPGEKEGVSYYFVTPEEFRRMIDHEEFLEYDEHNATLYGTPVAEVEKKLREGSLMLDIEPNGAFNVRAKRPDAKLIFVMPPSMEELEHRLRSRGDTPEEQIRMRLDRAAWEIEQSKKYDLIVINDQVEACADKILKFIAQTVDEE